MIIACYIATIYAVVAITTVIAAAVIMDDNNYPEYFILGLFWPLLFAMYVMTGLCILARKIARAIKRFTSKEKPCPEK